jgi:hypothetical protein
MWFWPTLDTWFTMQQSTRVEKGASSVPQGLRSSCNRARKCAHRQRHVKLQGSNGFHIPFHDVTASVLFVGLSRTTGKHIPHIYMYCTYTVVSYIYNLLQQVLRFTILYRIRYTAYTYFICFISRTYIRIQISHIQSWATLPISNALLYLPAGGKQCAASPAKKMRGSTGLGVAVALPRGGCKYLWGADGKEARNAWQMY